MKTKLVIATKNNGKVKEIKSILCDLPFDVVSMQEEGIEIDVVEDGSTFAENALIKAREIRKHIDAAVIADDSGLEVEQLNGAPGIYSARFAGEHADDEENNRKLLSMMEGIEDRKARYVCAIAVVNTDDSYFIVEGECRGVIGFHPEGKNGFGYDPLFYLSEYEATMAQLDPDIKNSISHRAKALQKMKEKLEG